MKAEFISPHPNLILMDEKSKWAEFTPHTVKIEGEEKKKGILVTEDPELIKRLEQVTDGTVKRVDKPKEDKPPTAKGPSRP